MTTTAAIAEELHIRHLRHLRRRRPPRGQPAHTPPRRDADRLLRALVVWRLAATVATTPSSGSPGPASVRPRARAARPTTARSPRRPRRTGLVELASPEKTSPVTVVAMASRAL